MPSENKYRRVWFSIMKGRRVPEESRHALQEALTGKPSTKDWTKDDWDKAIAAMQRDGGDHHDAHAHVREDRPHGMAVEPGAWATDAQARTIENLCDSIAWKAGRADGPRKYVVSWALRGPEKALRRELIKRAKETGFALWLRLTRQEAMDLIRALLKMREEYPIEEAASAAR